MNEEVQGDSLLENLSTITPPLPLCHLVAFFLSDNLLDDVHDLDVPELSAAATGAEGCPRGGIHLGGCRHGLHGGARLGDDGLEDRRRSLAQQAEGFEKMEGDRWDGGVRKYERKGSWINPVMDRGISLLCCCR